MRRIVLLFVLLTCLPLLARAQPAAEEEEPAPAEATPAEAATPEGPMFVVSPPDLESGTVDPEEAQAVHDAYKEGDQTFIAVFWRWFLLIAILAGIGLGAWAIWGRKKPPRLTR